MAERDTCLDGGEVHAWKSTGLDTVDTDTLHPRPRDAQQVALCSTRRCVWCSREQATVYGARRTVWRDVT